MEILLLQGAEEIADNMFFWPISEPPSVVEYGTEEADSEQDNR
jgi:hypothetical protein